MKKFRVTRTEVNTFTIEIWAETHDQAEVVARFLPEDHPKWISEGYCIDYVPQYFGDDDEEEE